MTRNGLSMGVPRRGAGRGRAQLGLDVPREPFYDFLGLPLYDELPERRDLAEDLDLGLDMQRRTAGCRLGKIDGQIDSLRDAELRIFSAGEDPGPLHGVGLLHLDVEIEVDLVGAH